MSAGAQPLTPSGAEPWLAALEIPLSEEDFGREDEPDIAGCILAQYHPGGVRMRAVIRPGLPSGQREMFDEWAAARFLRLVEHGPDPDGWYERASDGAWQLWARHVQMPPLD